MSTVAFPPPVRHGKCALRLSIGGTHYKLRPVSPAPGGWRIVWHLRKLDPERQALYTVGVPKGEEARCTCPDHELNGATCKHVMALAALGLVPRPKAARPKKARQPSQAKARAVHARNAEAAIAEAKADVPASAGESRAPAQRPRTPGSFAPPPPRVPGPASEGSFTAGIRAAIDEHLRSQREGVRS